MSGYTHITNEIDAEAEAALREVEDEELREAEARERKYQEAERERMEKERIEKEKGDDVLEEYRKADAKALDALGEEEVASKKRERDEAEDVKVEEEEEGDNKKIAVNTEPVTVA